MNRSYFNHTNEISSAINYDVRKLLMKLFGQNILSATANIKVTKNGEKIFLVMLIITKIYSCSLKWISSWRVLKSRSKKVKTNTEHKVKRHLAEKTTIQRFFKDFSMRWVLSEAKYEKKTDTFEENGLSVLQWQKTIVSYHRTTPYLRWIFEYIH